MFVLCNAENALVLQMLGPINSNTGIHERKPLISWNFDEVIRYK